MPRILIVEDNEDLAFGLRAALEFEGYAVDVADDGRAGLKRARAGGVDLIILDLMLPFMDGHQVLGTLRTEGVATPVLVQVPAEAGAAGRCALGDREAGDGHA